MNAQTQIATIEPQRRSVLIDMASRYGMEPQAFEATLRATVVPGNCSREQFAAFLLVAKEYNLNPLTKEIYAFPGKGGGIQPIVSVDGWCNLANTHPKMNGVEFDDHIDDAGKLVSITARIWRKDRDKPIVVTEYMDECARGTEPWQKWPRRMLRHKAFIQCIRYAFGFSGIVDPDEAERTHVAPMRDVTPAQRQTLDSFAGPSIAPEPDASEQVDQQTGEVQPAEQAEQTGTRGRKRAAATKQADEKPQDGEASQGAQEPAGVADGGVATQGTPAADKPATTAPAASGSTPKTAAEYQAHASAWIDAATDPDATQARWTSEKKLRNTCGVTEEVYDPLKKALDAKVAALRGA